MDRIEYVYTFGMTDKEVSGYLEEGEVGVLSLATDGRAYAIPVGYVFDGSSLFIRLSEEHSNEKMAFLDGTTEACFLLYDVEGSASWSIVVTGGLSELEADERAAFDPARINEEFQRLRVFDEDIEAVDVSIYELEIGTLTGRRTEQ